jgi:hypothetical protein
MPALLLQRLVSEPTVGVDHESRFHRIPILEIDPKCEVVQRRARWAFNSRHGLSDALSPEDYLVLPTAAERLVELYEALVFVAPSLGESKLC